MKKNYTRAALIAAFCLSSNAQALPRMGHPTCHYVSSNNWIVSGRNYRIYLAGVDASGKSVGHDPTARAVVMKRTDGMGRVLGPNIYKPATRPVARTYLTRCITAAPNTGLLNPQLLP